MPVSLSLDLGVIDNHVRDVILNRVDAPALLALEPSSIGGKFHWEFTHRADQDIKQFFSDGHDQPPNVRNVSGSRRNFKLERRVPNTPLTAGDVGGRLAVPFCRGGGERVGQALPLRRH